MVFSKNHYRFFLLILILFGFGWGLHTAPLFDEDEGFFAEGTREMALREEFITTYVNQEVRFDKPPLTNWLQYLSARVLGLNEMAMRLPSALAAVAWMGILFFFVRRRLGEDPALYATLMATCSLQVTIIGKAALADSLLNATLAGAMFCLYMLLNVRQRPYVWVFYALSGIGFLTKGPIAVLIPGAVLMFYLLRWREWRPLLQLVDPLGVALFSAIGFPWYVIQYKRVGPAFLEGFFLHHNVHRFQTAFEGHYGGLLYFVPILLVGLLPFTGIQLKALTRARMFWNDRFFSFLLLWFLFVFVFFSLSGTKLHHYLIYGYTPLFVLGGWYAYQTSQHPLGWPMLLFLLLLTVLPLVVPYVLHMVNDPYARVVIQEATELFDASYLVAMVGLMALTEWVDFRRSWDKKLRMLILGLIMLITINVLWMPRLGMLLQQPVKEAALVARTLKPAHLVVNDRYTPSFYFYSGLFAEERPARPGDVVFAKKHLLGSFKDKEILYEKYGQVLARIRK
jgi:4-amino-4-deoxy-L-arabinose transferase-like glycosyltransferase